jgi:hypothetical protein
VRIPIFPVGATDAAEWIDHALHAKWLGLQQANLVSFDVTGFADALR